MLGNMDPRSLMHQPIELTGPSTSEIAKSKPSSRLATTESVPERRVNREISRGRAPSSPQFGPMKSGIPRGGFGMSCGELEVVHGQNTDNSARVANCSRML